MSIFKRFSSKKTGDNASDSEALLHDENASLTEDDAQPNIPVSADDAIPSLKGFTENEQDVIRSILSDQPLPASNFHKTNRKNQETTKPETTKTEEPIKVRSEKKSVKQKKKSLKKNVTVDDFLSDDTFKDALNILKGDLDIQTEYDVDDEDSPGASEEVETEETVLDAAKTETIDPIAETETAEPEVPDYPDKLTARATFIPIKEQQSKEDRDIDLPEEKIEPEVEFEAESASDNLRLSGEEEMTSSHNNDEAPRDDTRNDIRDETQELRRQADVRYDDIANTQRRINLGEMRMDVASIITDIENGDSMYRRAQQRVENLTGFIERAEVDFSLLDRLEPENRVLKSENLTLHSELDKRKTRIAQMTTNLEDLQRRYGDTQSELDATHSKLAQSVKNYERAERDISELNAQIQEFRLKSDRMRNDLEVESRENGNLRGRIADITTHLDKVTSEKLNLAKQIETLKIDLADQSENRLQLRDEVTDLRHTLEDAQRSNTQMRGEISGVHEDIRGFKTQYEFNILKRDERITDLESQIVELNERLRVKEDQFETSSRELTALRKERTSQDLERERLEKSVEQANSQLYRTEEELLRSRKAADELDMKYRDISSALSRAEQRRQSSQPAQTPDITPPPFHEPRQDSQRLDIQRQEIQRQEAPRQEWEPSRQTFETDDIAISPSTYNEAAQPAPTVPRGSEAPQAERIAPTRQITDDIEDMLTDYKLGIRKLG